MFRKTHESTQVICVFMRSPGQFFSSRLQDTSCPARAPRSWRRKRLDHNLTFRSVKRVIQRDIPFKVGFHSKFVTCSAWPIISRKRRSIVSDQWHKTRRASLLLIGSHSRHQGTAWLRDDRSTAIWFTCFTVRLIGKVETIAHTEFQQQVEE